MTPFVSFYTPTYRRPTLLAACKRSVENQTVFAEGQIEQVVIEDTVGVGIGGMYAAVPLNAHLMTGKYVHMLADDDELASPHAVALVHYFAVQRGFPDVILVNSVKRMEQGPLRLPVNWEGVPVEGWIDLGCLITRNDVWQQHVDDYGKRYAGDADFAVALYRAGRHFERLDLDFVTGAVMRGRPE